MGLRVVRFECDGAAARGDRIIEETSLPERVSQIIVKLGNARLELQRASKRGDGFVQLAQFPERVA
jgi:hypothetical protein